MERPSPFYPVVAICALILALSTLAQAQYGGGTGEPNDPYLITTAEQMNAIGADPNNWDKHFKLMADIDLSTYTGTKFNLIGAVSSRRGSASLEEGFAGLFDGNGHNISNFTYASEGVSGIGLFRFIDDPNAEIRNLGLVTPSVDGGAGDYVGALVGRLVNGTLTDCYTIGASVSGGANVGALVGYGGDSLTECYATGIVRGHEYVGGLVGYGVYGTISACYSETTVIGVQAVGCLAGYSGSLITNCYSTGTARGEDGVGGLVGCAYGTVTTSFSTATVLGTNDIGGLVGRIWAGARRSARNPSGNGNCCVTDCYATGTVIGSDSVGGLVGDNSGTIENCYAAGPVIGVSHTSGLVGEGSANASFWDLQTSRQEISGGGTGKTTAQMQTLVTFLTWGQGDNTGVWTIDEGNDYPRLAWENRPGVAIEPMELSDVLAGTGTRDDPFLIYTAEQLDLAGQFPNEWDKHYQLMADIDLATFTRSDFHILGRTEPFRGTFDGDRHAISNFTYRSVDGGRIGLFGYVHGEDAAIRNLTLLDPDIDVAADSWSREGVGVGALAGHLGLGTVKNCCVEGGIVTGGICTGGLVGCNGDGVIRECYSATVVVGTHRVGGLVGESHGGMIVNCRATGAVVGSNLVGGLLGYSYPGGAITNCYATGFVVGGDSGGLVGVAWGEVATSFWDIQTSGRDTHGYGIGSPTAEMQVAATFLEAGWDFVGEVENGVEEIWWIDEGVDYPRLWWEDADAEF